jgi:hypothetical protein
VSDTDIVLRFVQGKDALSQMIVHGETMMPFAPSHVEAVTPNGYYLGAHTDTGVEERKPGYDSTWVALELILPLPATAEQHDSFYSYLRAHIGDPYDWQAIPGFLVPGHHHTLGHTICSALCVMALRAKNWFPFPLPWPAHLISPGMLLGLVGVKVKIPM